MNIAIIDRDVKKRAFSYYKICKGCGLGITTKWIRQVFHSYKCYRMYLARLKK